MFETTWPLLIQALSLNFLSVSGFREYFVVVLYLMCDSVGKYRPKIQIE